MTEIIETDNPFGPPPGLHEHSWTFGTMAVMNAQNKLTMQVTAIPSVVMTCRCGAILHQFLPDPVQPLTVEVPG